MKRYIDSSFLTAALGSDYKVVGNADELAIDSIITDSRSTLRGKNTLFAALRTRLNDGHNYIPELYGQGVRCFLVDKLPENPEMFKDTVFVCVSDVREALGRMSAFIVKDVKHQIVVTGSTLKTEVKETLYRGLKKAWYKVFRSPRSFNSYLGVCLSAFDYYFGGSDAEYLIFEVGIDGPGQAEAIRKILTPWIGIVTDITTEHDEQFSSHEEKIREKLKLLSGAEKVIYDATDPDISFLCSEMFEHFVLHALVGNTAQIAAIAFRDVEFTPIEPGSLRTAIIAGVDGRTLIYDPFTPDKDSLRYACDRLIRHRSPNTATCAVIGDVDDPDFNAAQHYGVEKLLYFPDYYPESYGRDVPVSPSAGRREDVLVFGEHTPALDAYVGKLEFANHDTTLTVDLDALVHNFNVFRHMVPAGTGIVAMVKASAYGIGAIETAKALQNSGAAKLAVAVVDEGVEMRAEGITMPIMVMNPMTNRYSALFRQRLEPAVFSIPELERLIDEAKKEGVKHYPIHIKLDTGMHRVGFVEESLPQLIELLESQDRVVVDSVFSHLATADCLDKDDYTRGQIDKFYRVSRDLERGLGYKVKRHILNTAGMMRFADCGDYEMARLGIGLYGISPLPGKDARLKPVAALRSVVISLKHWPAGTPIGYSNRGVTSRDSVIATIPIGYADGIDRRLGNGATSFVVNGVECPTIGNICMDMCMIDVTDAPNVEVGTEVEIFGPNMPVEKVADILGTIPYEILTSVSPRVQRRYLTK